MDYLVPMRCEGMVFRLLPTIRPSRFLLEPLPAVPALLTSMDGGNAEDCREQSRPPSMAVVKPGRSGYRVIGVRGIN